MQSPRPRRTGFVATCLIGLILFGFSTVVQYNDPDPVGWMAIYGAAALACLYGCKPGISPLPAALVAAVALGWALMLAPQAWRHGALGDVLDEMHTSNPGIELSRELLGLLLVAAWMSALAVVGRRRRKTATSSSSAA